MVALKGLSDWAPGPILLFGDLMLDRYTWGCVDRISPEAPVPVLHVEREEERAGGAGNVALNLVSLGARVYMAGRVGDDVEGLRLLQVLGEGGVDTSAVVKDASPTPVKQRLLAQGQQLVRIDRELTIGLGVDCFEELKRRVEPLLSQVSLIVLSDYAKGALTPELVRWITQQGRRHGVRVVIDPKGVHWDHYRGAALIKPNWGEAKRALHGRVEGIQAIGEQLLEQLEVEALAITRAQDGVSLFLKEGRRVDYPALVREVKDVTGAGDTVLAVMGAALASGASYEWATHLGNLAGGIAVEHVGCHRITLEELAMALGRSDWRSKVVDRANVPLLGRLLRDRQVVLVVVREETGLRPWTQFHALTHEAHHRVVAVVPPDSHADTLCELCACLRHVHFVVRHGDLNLVREQLNPRWVFDGEPASPLTNKRPFSH